MILSYGDYEAVYQINARKLIGLRERITEEVRLLTQPMVERVLNRFSQRLEQCRLVQGHQLRDVIEKNYQIGINWHEINNNLVHF